MGADKKKQRREENRALSGFFVQTGTGRVSVKDLDEVKSVLNTLGEPYREVLTDMELFYFFVIFAWNLSFAPEDIFDRELDNFMSPYAAHSEEFQSAARALIVDLVERKKQLFPRDRYTFGTYLDEGPLSAQ